MSTHTSPTKNVCEPYPYPLCWQDDERVQVLLSPFRDRSVNPESYDAKMKFWQDTIREYCLIKGKANFSQKELQLNFTKGQRVPCCLSTVIEEMQRKRIIRLRKDYEYDPENSWSGWMVNSFVRKPFAWGFDQIKVKLGALDEAQLAAIQFIHLDVINKYSLELLELLYEPPFVGTVNHYDALQKELCTAANISEEALRMCLNTLYVKRKIGLEYKPNANEPLIHLVKIPSNEDDIAITETDQAIHNLQVTKTNLEKQLEEIEHDVKENEDRARQLVKENKKLLAKTFLRKKHLSEKNHERRSMALHNIETLLSNVHEAKLNGNILDAYKFGSKALQNVLESSNLKYDNVDEIVSDVRETMDSYREVQDSLSNANFDDSSASLDDEDELERELKEIMGETNTPTKEAADKSNVNNSGVSFKVEISDAELIDMLNGLEVEENSPDKDVSKTILLSSLN